MTKGSKRKKYIIERKRELDKHILFYIHEK
jgi:hypothetical protein